jgi:hypothetical protein
MISMHASAQCYLAFSNLTTRIASFLVSPNSISELIVYLRFGNFMNFLLSPFYLLFVIKLVFLTLPSFTSVVALAWILSGLFMSLIHTEMYHSTFGNPH